MNNLYISKDKQFKINQKVQNEDVFEIFDSIFSNAFSPHPGGVFYCI